MLKHEEKIFEGYQDEMDYFCENEQRNKFIRNLACDLKGNTLVLFNYVEKHGLPLYDMINNYTDRPVHLVYGGVDVDDREEIRRLVENEMKTMALLSPLMGLLVLVLTLKGYITLYSPPQASQESETFSLSGGYFDSLGGKQ